MKAERKERFQAGRVVVTAGALAATTAEQQDTYLSAHLRGDWGAVGAEQWQLNDDSLEHGRSLLSAYPIDPAKPCNGFGDNTVWIKTHGDRSVTTIMLPDEY